MPASNSRRALPSAARVACYNAVPSVGWSVLALGPVGLFCYQHVGRPWLWSFGAVSLLAYAWPAAWLRRLQLSSTLGAYQRLRVPVLNRFTQNGALVNGLLRRRYPHYPPRPTAAALAQLRRTTYQQERFHWAALVFFLLAGGYALAQGLVGWAVLLAALNVGYNLYPIWLQQYLRLRLQRLQRAA